MITLDEMIDNAFNQPLPPQLTPEEILALHEAGKNGTLKLEVYVSPQEYAKQYLATSRQTYFCSTNKER